MMGTCSKDHTGLPFCILRTISRSCSYVFNIIFKFIIICLIILQVSLLDLLRVVSSAKCCQGIVLGAGFFEATLRSPRKKLPGSNGPITEMCTLL